MQNSAQFNLKRHLVSARLRAASQQLWAHPDIVQLYPIMLFRIHCMARATVPLMEAAIEQLRSRPTEPVTAALIDYFTQQIPQETGHDGWLLEDLEALGIPRQQTLAQTPPPMMNSLPAGNSSPDLSETGASEHAATRKNKQQRNNGKRSMAKRCADKLTHNGLFALIPFSL